MRRVALILIPILILTTIIVLIFPSQPSETEQLKDLNQEADIEISTMVGGTQYTKEKLGSRCWAYANSGDRKDSRSCSLGIKLISNLPKSEITQRIINNGWQKKTYNPGSKIEHADYLKEGANCYLWDEQITIMPQPDGSLRKINDYYTVTCSNTTHDRGLGNLLAD